MDPLLKKSIISFSVVSVAIAVLAAVATWHTFTSSSTKVVNGVLTTNEISTTLIKSETITAAALSIHTISGQSPVEFEDDIDLKNNSIINGFSAIIENITATSLAATNIFATGGAPAITLTQTGNIVFNQLTNGFLSVVGGLVSVSTNGPGSGDVVGPNGATVNGITTYLDNTGKAIASNNSLTLTGSGVNNNDSKLETANGGAFVINTGTGPITLSGDGTISTVNIATGAAAKTVNIGSTGGGSVAVKTLGQGVVHTSAIGTLSSSLVGTDDLESKSITSGKLATNSVQTINITDASITPGKLSVAYLPVAGGTVTGTVAFSNNSASTGPTSGAVVVTGGIGVGQNISTQGEIRTKSNVVLEHATGQAVQIAATGGNYTITLPTTSGIANQFLQTDGSGNTTWAPVGGGAVSGPTTSTTNSFATYANGSGDVIASNSTLTLTADGKNSTIATTDNGTLALNSGTGTITLSGDDTATTVNIATGAAAKTVNIGSTSGGSVAVKTLGQGVVHTNSLGILSASTLVNDDFTDNTISGGRLQDASIPNGKTSATSSGTAETIVLRGPDGKFTATQITITGGVTNDTDVATKVYVDGKASGLTVKTPVFVYAPLPVTLSGDQTVDGKLVTDGNRVLVANQADSKNNGIYVVNGTGTWDRTVDMALTSNAQGAYVLVQDGTTLYKSTAWVVSSPTEVIVGTNDIVFVLFSQPSTNFLPLTGGTLTGNLTAPNIDLVGEIKSSSVDVKGQVQLGSDNSTADIKIGINEGGSGKAISIGSINTGTKVTLPGLVDVGTGTATTTTNIATGTNGVVKTVNIGNTNANSYIVVPKFTTADALVTSAADGKLSHGLLVNANVSSIAAISGSKLQDTSIPTIKLQNVSSTDQAGDTLVVRNSGSFSAKQITLSDTPTTNNQVATKGYVDTKSGDFLPLAGGTLTGTLNATTVSATGEIKANSLVSTTVDVKGQVQLGSDNSTAYIKIGINEEGLGKAISIGSINTGTKVTLPGLVDVGTGTVATTTNIATGTNGVVKTVNIGNANTNSYIVVPKFTTADAIVTSAADGKLSHGLLVNANVSSIAAISGSKLQDTSIPTNKLISISSTDQTGSDIVVRSSGSFSAKQITLSDLPTTNNQVATKGYVDGMACGITVKTPVLLYSGSNITLSGNQSIDGIMTVDSNRVLVNGQTNPIENGIYVANTSAWTPAADMPIGSDPQGSYAVVSSGATKAGFSYITSSEGKVGTDPVVFVEFSQPPTNVVLKSGGPTGGAMTGDLSTTTNITAVGTITAAVMAIKNDTKTIELKAPVLAADLKMTLPNTGGAAGEVLSTSGGPNPTLAWVPTGGGGNVSNSSGSINNELPIYDGTLGTTIKQSKLFVTPSGNNVTMSTASDGTFDLHTGTGTISIGSDATVSELKIGTGGEKKVTVGNTAGASATTINAGTGNLVLATSGAGIISVNPTGAGLINVGSDDKTGAINIGTDGARTIVIGNTSVGKTTSIGINSAGTLINTSAGAMSFITTGLLAAGRISINPTGTGPIDIGTNDIVRTITIGNALSTITIGNAFEIQAEYADVKASNILSILNENDSTGIGLGSFISYGGGSFHKTLNVGNSMICKALQIRGGVVEGSIYTVQFRAPLTLPSDIAITLPSNGGIAGQFLQTSGSSSPTLAWAAAVTNSTGSASNEIPIYNGVSGQIIERSGLYIAQTGDNVVMSTTNNGTFELKTGTGTVSLGAGIAARIVSVGSSVGDSNTNINAGTGNLVLATTTGIISINPTGNGDINIGTAGLDGGINIGTSGTRTVTVGGAFAAVTIASNVNMGANTLTTTGTVSTGPLVVTSSDPSTSSTTGAIKVAGGVGIALATDATSATNGGALTVAGGVGIGGKLFVAGTLTIGTSITTLSTTTIFGLDAVGTGTNAVSIGQEANASANFGISIGYRARAPAVGVVTIGSQNAGLNALAGAICIGYAAGSTTVASGVGLGVICIGEGAGSGGTLSTNAIVIGKSAGNGEGAGVSTINISASGVGSLARVRGILINTSAGTAISNASAIMLTTNTNNILTQAVANSILINASGAGFSSVTSGCYIAPIRAESAVTNMLHYNTTSNEVMSEPFVLGYEAKTVILTNTNSDTVDIKMSKVNKTVTLMWNDMGFTPVNGAGNIEFAIGNASFNPPHDQSVFVRLVSGSMGVLAIGLSGTCTIFRYIVNSGLFTFPASEQVTVLGGSASWIQ
jgi:trimeric autotransporter adhesin